MAFDFKKEYKEFYLPARKPSIVTVPVANYIAVRGAGDPNAEDGAYKQSISTLYALAFTLKMSYKTDYKIEGYYPYVVPPLEGLWWKPEGDTDYYNHKETLQWLSLIRLPEFITRENFQWAVDTATKKKQQDFSNAQFLTIDEGLCVQCMHVGPYDAEPATMDLMTEYMAAQGYADDVNEARHHHEIYLSDPRRCAPDKLRTVIRHPVRRIS